MSHSLRRATADEQSRVALKTGVEAFAAANAYSMIKGVGLAAASTAKRWRAVATICA
jgi:hypothetical protein